MITRESRLFLRRWLHSPMHVGSIAPSSRKLADAIASQVPLERPGWIVELGGGTGVVTAALLRAGLAPRRLVVIERDPQLHRHLLERFPDANILLADAAKLAEALKPLGIKPPGVGAPASAQVAAIVSGLPLLTFPRQVQDDIVHGAFSYLPPGAPLLQFTYGPMSPLPRERLKLEGRVAHRIIGNLPPASIWVYHRAGEAPAAYKGESARGRRRRAG
jgi:phosphatidylethanolamine/phosphatidyl-N-methylethanolamine N-methyltransferase